MSRKIDDLFGADIKARENIILVSMVATFIVSLVFLMGGVSLKIVQIVAIAVGTVSYFSQIAVYKYSPRIKWKRSERGVPSYNFLTPFSTLSVTSIIVIMLFTASPKIQASVLNRRLRAVLETPPSTKRSAETRRILNYATQSNVKLLPDLILKTVSETEKQNDPESWATYLSAVTLQVKALDVKFVDIAKASSDYGALDGYILNDSSISGFKFAYRGGQLRLDKATFRHDTIAVADNENGRRFVEAFTKAPDGAVSIDLYSRLP